MQRYSLTLTLVERSSRSLLQHTKNPFSTQICWFSVHRHMHYEALIPSLLRSGTKLLKLSTVNCKPQPKCSQSIAD